MSKKETDERLEFTMVHVSLLTPFPPLVVRNSNHQSVKTGFHPSSALVDESTGSPPSPLKVCARAFPVSP